MRDERTFVLRRLRPVVGLGTEAMARVRLYETLGPPRLLALHFDPSLSSMAPAATASTSSSTHAPAAVPDDLSVLLVTAGYDHTIRFWEAWSGICSRTIQHPDSQVNRLAISPDKRWLASCGVGVVRLYDCRSALAGNQAASIQAGAQGGAAAGASGAAAAASGAPGVTQPVATFEGHHGNVTCVAWHCESKWLVSGGEDGTLRIWDTRESQPDASGAPWR